MSTAQHREGDEDSEAILTVRLAGAQFAYYRRRQSSLPGSSLEGKKLEMVDRRNYCKCDLEEEVDSQHHKYKYLILF